MRRIVYATAGIALLGCGGSDGGTSPNPTPASIVIAVGGGAGNMTAVGQTRTLTATVRDASNNAIPGAQVSWSSEDPDIVSISPATGATTTATAAGDGTATITASSGSVEETRDVTVDIGGGSGNAAVTATAGTSFDPPTVTIADEGTVTWTFQATHNVQFANAAGAPANIGNTTAGSVSRTFSTPGTFEYTCGLHPGMSGTVVVEAP